MQEFNEVKDMVYDEIDKIVYQGKLNKETLCILGELVDILKDIGTVEMFEEGISVPEDEYSLASGSYNRNNGYSYRNGRMYGYDGGYRNGRDYGSKYSRRGRGGYSMEDAHDHMMSQLHSIMNEAQNDEDRQAVKKLIEQMSNK